MAIKTSEMKTVRCDLALDLEAGFDSYLDDVAEGYEKFLAPVLEEGEAPPDIRVHLILLRRSVAWQREHLDDLDGDAVEQSGADVTVSSGIQKATAAMRAKLGFVRDTCRGVYGKESLKRVALVGDLPRSPVRLHSKARDVRRALRNPETELTPVLSAGENALTPKQLAKELAPELEELGRYVGARHHGRRKGGDVRSRRQRKIEEFDYAIRAIVRMAQGIFRLAGRDDLARRFRPLLKRTLRKLDEAESREQAGAEAEEGAAAPETAGAETAPTDDAAASEETTA